MSDAAVKLGHLTLQDALAEREPTFLANYPRAIKLVGLAAGLTLVLALIHLTGWIISALIPDHVAHKKTHDDLRLEQEQVLLVPQTVFEKGSKKAVRHLPRTEEELEAAAINDSDTPSRNMAPAPDPLLIENTAFGTLPKIHADGRKPWQVYARPFDHRDPRPRIALVVGDLGLSRVATDAAISRLPGSVTLAFEVQGTAIGAWLERARSAGHETLLSLPMEPFDFPRSDPGPRTLLTSLPNTDNLERLLRFLGEGTGYVGITTLSGARFSTDVPKSTAILEETRRRGLLVFDAQVVSHSVIGHIARQLNLPAALNNRTIDALPSPDSIDTALAALEQTARVEGSAVGLATPLPVTIERIELWAKGLSSRGIVLAPISAVAE